MAKSAPTLGRVLTMVGFALSCFGLLLFLWLAFGGAIPLAPKGYRFQMLIPEATQLAKEADVRISGVPVGKVKLLEPQPTTGLTRATIELEGRYAPIPKDSRAILRQKTLLGETYVELTPGTAGKDMALAEDGTLAKAQIAPTVELDEIFRSLDEPTRNNFRAWLDSQARAFDGRGPDINDALANLAPFAEDSNALVQVLNSQQRAVQRLVGNTGDVFAALTARDSELASLITNSNRVFEVTAARDQALKETFRVFPTFEDESKQTLDRLAAFAQNTDPLVTQLRPAAREIAPTFKDLSLLAPDLKGLFRDLGPLIDASEKGLPAVRTVLDETRPVLAQLDPFLREFNPILRYIGEYDRELSAFFANTVASTQGVSFPARSGGRPVHYLRTTNPVGPENLVVYNRRLKSNRTNAYALPGAFNRPTASNTLETFENRQCRNGADPPSPPSGNNPLVGLIFDTTLSLVSGEVPAPPCVLQRRQADENTDFPQVERDRAIRP